MPIELQPVVTFAIPASTPVAMFQQADSSVTDMVLKD